MTNEELKRSALELLLRNRKTGYSDWTKKEYDFSCPSPRDYPYQWFWDSCFHSIALSHLDVELAKKELESLLSFQQPDGFIPHVIFWRLNFFRPRMKMWRYLQGKGWSFRPRFTGMIQPPVLGIAVETVYAKTRDADFLDRVLPLVEKYFLWLDEFRDPDNDNLISIINPHESGLDWSPHFDETLGFKEKTKDRKRLRRLGIADRLCDFRNKIHGFDSKKILALGYYDVEDVMMNVVYGASLKSIGRLFEIQGKQEKAISFYEKSRAVTKSLVLKCLHDDGLFYSIWGKEEKKLLVKTFVSLMPIMLEDMPRNIIETLVERHLINAAEFWPPYPIPSVALDEPTFDPAENRFIWRGPTWMNTNWFIVRGLRYHGYNEIADEIVEKSKLLIERSGFREYFNPFTGEGYDTRDFGWSTLIVDMIE